MAGITEIMDVTVLGRILGIASGWDEADAHSVQFYDVGLNETGKKLLGTDVEKLTLLQINFETGETYAERVVPGTEGHEEIVKLKPFWLDDDNLSTGN